MTAQGEADGIVIVAGEAVSVKDNFIAGLRAGTFVAGIGVSEFSENVVIANNTILDGETTGADTVYGIDILDGGGLCLNNVINGFSTAASYGCVPATCDDGRADTCATGTTGAAVSGGRARASLKPQ